MIMTTWFRCRVIGELMRTHGMPEDLAGFVVRSMGHRAMANARRQGMTVEEVAYEIVGGSTLLAKTQCNEKIVNKGNRSNVLQESQNEPLHGQSAG